MTNTDLTTAGWKDYELLDSGDNRKLERFGTFTVIRPETQAIWKPARPELWKRADAEFRFDGGKGSWRGKPAPNPWVIGWNSDLKCLLRLTAFKHTGIFPEQEPNWRWIAERVDALAKKSGGGRGGNNDGGKDGKHGDTGTPKILDLFGYTGAASIVAARHGAAVTHVDASKQSNAWARENAALSGIPVEAGMDPRGAGRIRWITDDALKFVEREARRDSAYDGIILDPPAFGRGPAGEVWRIEEDIIPLLNAVKKIFAADKPGSFFLLNGYAAGYAPLAFAQAVESARGTIKNAQFGELQIDEKDSRRTVPSGIYTRFVVK